MRVRAPAVVGILLVLLSAQGLAQSGDPVVERMGRLLFDRAERLEARGSYENAVTVYSQILDDWDDSEVAAEAARRTEPGRVLRRRLSFGDGPSRNRLDLVIMGEGFRIQRADQEVFELLAGRFLDALLANPTVAAYATHLHVHLVNLWSRQTGIDTWRQKYDTALGARELPGGRGEITVDSDRVRAVLAEVDEADGIAFVLVRGGWRGVPRPGLAVVVASRLDEAARELGFALGELADESRPSWGMREVGAAPNVAIEGDVAAAPWRHWIESGTDIGLFECPEAGVPAFRPTDGACVMGSGRGDFCAVCREHVVQRLYGAVSPIEPTAKAPPVRVLGGDEAVTLSVQGLAPAAHDLEYQWRVERLADSEVAAAVARRGAPTAPRAAGLARLTKTPEMEPAGEALDFAVSDSGVSTATFSAAGRAPGFYRVVVVARDPTPWVRRDDRHLLADRRDWLIEIR